ncbi:MULTISPECIES: hypothetical protein [Comamonas]|jgi:hypothetical protein|uniref:hypothetical protein n=1 Tax=Comamonas TaxID=283 RepID=UPI00244C813D|nr:MULTISPECIES: hypothetical protein [Comamonas]MDH0051105.1 hypothetical protein [Comamonas terrigena]MDH0513556.1 hypothetical protein [Comamonas terrigena]MDH1093050.1 hypothetical protein [Comamonas terrigena]MDH1503028.1 hypothetical protein [Comamonas terrigena]MDI9853874.1 hypothetical protein [Comamonas sp. 17RB]
MSLDVEQYQKSIQSALRYTADKLDARSALGDQRLLYVEQQSLISPLLCNLVKRITLYKLLAQGLLHLCGRDGQPITSRLISHNWYKWSAQLNF